MPDTAKVVVALSVAAVIGMVFLGPASHAVDQNSGATEIENETIPVDFDDYVELRGYDLHEDSETVYAYNESADAYEEAAEGTDYEIRYTEGEVQALNSTLVADGEQLMVTYTYQASDELTATVLEFLPMMLGLLIFVGIARRVQMEMS